ncbi:MAG: hypoxanthine phosphoribosyltransferase [Planctomycetota bacterium]|nr:MAG: hypoxanthine phosphoribosyltransferase [Planctomycetota bacterium]
MPDASPMPKASPMTSPIAYPDRAQLLYGGPEIAATVYRMGREIRAVYGQEEVTVVAVLHGAIVFCADLIRQLDMPLQLETISARSYRGTDTTPGDLTVRVDWAGSLEDQHVLLVEDILDTGRTLTRLKQEVGACNPRSLRIATLLDKPERRVTELEADFVGFKIPDLFVVGYGLDHDGRWRNLPDILALQGEGE